MPERSDSAVILKFPRPERVDKGPVVVICGLHGPRKIRRDSDVMARCRLILGFARSKSVPLAFARYLPSGRKAAVPDYPKWIRDFEPTKRDMIFDMLQPSYYANAEFARTLCEGGGAFILLGHFEDLGCVRTAAEAERRGHHVTLLSDAFTCPAPHGVSARKHRCSVTELFSHYGEVSSSLKWIAAHSAGASASPHHTPSSGEAS